MTMPPSVAPPLYYRKPHLYNNILLGGCVLRWDTKSDTGTTVVPRIHANGTHIDVGVKEVRIDWSSNATVAAHRPLIIECEIGSPIISMGAVPDETMNAKGIIAGLSGGSPTTRMYLFRQYAEGSARKIHAASLDLYDQFANFWVWWFWWGGDSKPVQEVLDQLTAADLALMQRIAAAEARLAAQEGINAGARLLTAEQSLGDLVARMGTLEGRTDGLQERIGTLETGHQSLIERVETLEAAGNPS